MTFTERQIEDLIYSSPWIIDERFIIPEIVGKHGQNGRQINLGKTNNRYIDLLFKDTRDNRPVIIELKKGWLCREDVGQILEYRALLISLDDNEKDKWEKEFGQNYYSPRMILVGNGINEDIFLSANLSGVQVRTFNTEYNDIGFDSFKKLKTKLKEWKDFRNTGKRTLIERGEWIDEILEKLKRNISKFKDISTIEKIPEISEKRYYANNYSPFIDFPVFYKEDKLFGFYEYFDEELPFNDSHIYCDYEYLMPEGNESIRKDIITDLKNFLKVNKIDFVKHSDHHSPILKIPRPNLESDTEFEQLIKLLIKKGIELYNKQYNTE